MTKIINQLFGTVAKVSRSGQSTVIDFTGTVTLFGGTSSTGENIKFVLTPIASAANTALIAASIGRRLELAGSFKQDAGPDGTVRAREIQNIIVG